MTRELTHIQWVFNTMENSGRRRCYAGSTFLSAVIFSFNSQFQRLGGERYDLIRKRESFKDLVANVLVPEDLGNFQWHAAPTAAEDALMLRSKLWLLRALRSAKLKSTSVRLVQCTCSKAPCVARALGIDFQFSSCTFCAASHTRTCSAVLCKRGALCVYWV